ncbi:hypothetical protein J6590_072110 [Homalodisca vitripennis]|nr:hypothetical protein J6590_072110 [Homalodisca vitripennis]
MGCACGTAGATPSYKISSWCRFIEHLTRVLGAQFNVNDVSIGHRLSASRDKLCNPRIIPRDIQDDPIRHTEDVYSFIKHPTRALGAQFNVNDVSIGHRLSASRDKLCNPRIIPRDIQDDPLRHTEDVYSFIEHLTRALGAQFNVNDVSIGHRLSASRDKLCNPRIIPRDIQDDPLRQTEDVYSFIEHLTRALGAQFNVNDVSIGPHLCVLGTNSATQNYTQRYPRCPIYRARPFN